MNNDLISRQATIDAIVNTPTDVYSHDMIVSVLDGAAFRQNEIIDIIETLPSAQRKGKWIATQEWGGRNYSCSCCKFSFMVDTCMLEPMWKFCPNCGAEMKGEEDETD